MFKLDELNKNEKKNVFYYYKTFKNSDIMQKNAVNFS